MMESTEKYVIYSLYGGKYYFLKIDPMGHVHRSIIIRGRPFSLLRSEEFYTYPVYLIDERDLPIYMDSVISHFKNNKKINDVIIQNIKMSDVHPFDIKSGSDGIYLRYSEAKFRENKIKSIINYGEE